jgi:secreted PhoX family phosphatase
LGSALKKEFPMSSRREFLVRSLGAAAVLGMTPTVFRNAFAGSAIVGDSPYGALGIADVNGVRLPAGFSARIIGVSGQLVAGTRYPWHGQPDGGATFSTPAGGWVYVSNSELNGTRGGVGAVRFDAAGRIEDAYAILAGTKWNCAGGATPWNTWLSCEEHRAGVVWECDPFKPGQGVARPALGKFPHEAAVVDPVNGWVYLTEDDIDGRLYRFRPDVPQRLESGVLEAAAVDPTGIVTWVTVSPERPYRGADTTAFRRGEGAWYAGGHVYFCTTADNRVWALETASARLEVIYDATAIGAAAPLREPDNVTVHSASGDIYVAEDADDLQLVLLADADGMRIAAPFMQLVGHAGSEVAGPAFSPDGSRLYVSSQRGTGGGNNSPGITFEVSGPFRRR